jgi:hypothetical protein
MDRDAIIAHGGMAFVKESFMERSDGAKFPMCVACGTIPIYNPRLGIAICSLCDGPVKYIGDTINNLEILPPLGRPKSKIVEVEMPYSTKLLSQEQETYLNLTMRYITTSGVERLKPLEFSGTSSEVVKELPRLILPETVVPAYIEEVAPAVLTVDQLRTMGAQLATMSEAERAAMEAVLDDTNEGMALEQQAQMNAMAQLQNGVSPGNQIVVPGEALAQPTEVMGVQPVTVGGLLPPSMPALINSTVPQGEGFVSGPQVPGGGPVITVRTDNEAMMADGIMPGGFNMGRQPRRSFRSFGGMSGMGPMMPSAPRYTPMEGGNGMPSSVSSGGQITINKIE